jgi:tetratricopeptide (TPR) repeat protein
LIFVGSFLFSQAQVADSLIKLLPQQKEDTTKCLMLNDIARSYIAISDFEKAQDYSKEQLTLAEKIGYKRSIISANNNIGLVHFYRGDFAKCLEFYYKALKVAEETHNKAKTCKILFNIGNVYYSINQYSKALDIAVQVIPMAKSLGDSTTVANQYSTIGLIYKYRGKQNKDSLKQHELYIKALRSFQEAILIDSILGNKHSMSACLTNMGLLFESLHDSKNELFYHLYSLKLKREIEDNYGIGICYGNIGVYYLHHGILNAADTCLHQALKLAQLTGDLESMRQMNYCLSDLYVKQKKFELSLNHYGEYIKYRDSITNDANTKKQLEIEVNYQYDKKEAILKANAKKEQEKQQLIIYGVCIGLFLVLIFAGFMYNRFKVTQRQKKLIEEQKHLVEEKQKEILDSITYAKRIQQSLLPNEKYFEKNLKKK